MIQAEPNAPPADESARVAWVLYGLGLAIQCWLWTRSSYAWDQIELAKIGVDLISGGGLSGFGKPMSGGGVIPGSLLQLVVGLPLEIWPHFRSPALVVVAFHAIAGVVLLTLFRRALGARFAAIYLAVYWLGPWRLYHSGFVWEPNYILLPAALHLAATWSLRHEARFWPSVRLALILVLSPQLHVSAIVLTFITLYLLVRRRLRLHLAGALIGAGSALLTLMPMALALARQELPALAPGAQPGLGFARVFPLAKALGYWFRTGSVDIGRRLRQVVLFPGEEPIAFGAAAEGALQVLVVLAAATTLVALWASFRFLFRSGERIDSVGETGFFRQYAIASLLSLILAAGLTSQTVQGWHTIVVLHAASIPPAIWIAATWRGRRNRWVSWAVVAYLAVRLPVVAALGLGHPMYSPPDDPMPLDPVELDRFVDPRTLGEISGFHPTDREVPVRDEP